MKTLNLMWQECQRLVPQAIGDCHTPPATVLAPDIKEGKSKKVGPK